MGRGLPFTGKASLLEPSSIRRGLLLYGGWPPSSWEKNSFFQWTGPPFSEKGALLLWGRASPSIGKGLLFYGRRPPFSWGEASLIWGRASFFIREGLLFVSNCLPFYMGALPFLWERAYFCMYGRGLLFLWEGGLLYYGRGPPLRMERPPF